MLLTSKGSSSNDIGANKILSLLGESNETRFIDGTTALLPKSWKGVNVSTKGSGDDEWLLSVILIVTDIFWSIHGVHSSWEKTFCNISLSSFNCGIKELSSILNEIDIVNWFLKSSSVTECHHHFDHAQLVWHAAFTTSASKVLHHSLHLLYLLWVHFVWIYDFINLRCDEIKF